MFRKIDDFINTHKGHVDGVGKNLDSLTDESLKVTAYEGGRSLGALAWHNVQTISEMLNKTGLSVDEKYEKAPMPHSAAEIAAAYLELHATFAEKIKAEWQDADLDVEDEMYGSKWKRGFTIGCVLDHETHHHGQMSVLMRIAGLPVHGVYGPSKEEWAQYGMEQPKDQV